MYYQEKKGRKALSGGEIRRKTPQKCLLLLVRRIHCVYNTIYEVTLCKHECRGPKICAQ